MTLALVVDDSQFMRTVVSTTLEENGFEVIEAADGQEAVDAVEYHDPDVVTMDVAMPEMDGIEATEWIMDNHPTPILMVSAHTDTGADATLDALQKGAIDFLPKPGGEEVSVETDVIEDELIEKINAVMRADLSAVDTDMDGGSTTVDVGGKGEAGTMSLSASVSEPDAISNPEATASSSTQSRTSAKDITSVIERTLAEEYVANPTIIIGASTGGPKLVTEILRELPRAIDARVLIVQHMPEDFTRRFAQRLDDVSNYTVAEASDGERIGGGEARIAKGGRHLAVTSYSNGRLRLKLSDDEPKHGVKPAIDVTMTSAAATIEDPLVGVALTGMGQDGAKGIQSIKDAGGTTLVQDEETSPIFGIPQQAIATGAVDHVLPADQIVDAIVADLDRGGDDDG